MPRGFRSAAAWGGATLALLAACSPPAGKAPPPARTVDRSEQPLAPHTADSGGVLPPEQAALDFRHADLWFKVVPKQKYIEGDATLTFTARSPLPVLLLDLDPEFVISEVRIGGAVLPRTAWSDPDGRLRITLPQPAAAGGEIVARVRYGGKPHVAKRAPWDGGFVWARTPDGRPWVASAVEGEGCDLIWPCIDHPTGKPALADIHVTVPPGLAAPANGVLQAIRDVGNGWKTFDWRAKRPDTYAIAINVGPYDLLKSSFRSRFGNTIPMEFWYLRGRKSEAEALFATVPPMVAFNEAKIGPYPFGDEKIGMVETPHKGMEHQTINAYGNGYAIGEWGYDDLIQHEFGHEWFGNQMTNRDWSDMWLHEGFTMYLQPLYSQYLKGDQDYYAWLHDIRLKIANKAPTAPPGPMTGEVVYDDKRGGPGQDIYYKGALVLHTLRQLIGDRAFFQTLTELVYGRPDPRPGNFEPRFATTDDYVAIVSRITGKDYGWFFDGYLRNAALPELVQTRVGDSVELDWKTGDLKPFPMPLEVRIGDAITALPMTGGTGVVKVPPGVLVTIDPHSKVLRRDEDVEAYIAYRKAHPKGPPVPPAQQPKPGEKAEGAKAG